MTLQQETQKVYEDAYIEALKEAEPNEVKIGVTANGQTKVFTETNFYWCGFTWLEFAGKGKNLQLKKEFPVSKKYDGGFYLDAIDKIGNRGNGDHEIQMKAYYKVARFLNDKGFNVIAGGRLD